MDKRAKIYIAGHRGLVGSAIVRNLQAKGCSRLLLRTHAELDLTNQAAVDTSFAAERPEHVFLAAARVGGIHANNEYPAEFIRDNQAIQTNIIHAANRKQVVGFEGTICFDATKPDGTPRKLMDVALLNSIGWRANTPLAVGLDNAYSDHLAQIEEH